MFYAPREMLDHPRNLAGRFTRAIQRALEWTLAHDPAEATGVLQRHFPGLEPNLVIESVRACKARHVQVGSARIPHPSLERWQDVIVDGGLIDAPLSYADIVDSRAADWTERS